MSLQPAYNQKSITRKGYPNSPTQKKLSVTYFITIRYGNLRKNIQKMQRFFIRKRGVVPIVNEAVGLEAFFEEN
jgi:hypothetical protein